MSNVLVVVDMQNDFIDMALGTPEAQAIVQNVVDKINNFEGKVFATLDTHSDDYLETAEGKKLPVPHCIRGTEGWRVNKDVKKALKNKEAQFIEKNTFGSTLLPMSICDATRLNDNDTIEIVGLCTDICVVSNALILKAEFPDITMKVDSKCCAGVTPAKHEAALEVMRSCQIDVE